MTELIERERNLEDIQRFIERFAAALSESGMARMPARVFAGLLATDSGRLNAAEIAELLQISPAAVSGAVRYLLQVNLIRRERDPGSRRDVYRVHDDTWYEAAIRKDQALTRWEDSIREGLDVLGRDTPAGERMAETLAFFEFMQAELQGLMERWRERRDQLRNSKRS